MPPEETKGIIINVDKQTEGNLLRQIMRSMWGPFVLSITIFIFGWGVGKIVGRYELFCGNSCHEGFLGTSSDLYGFLFFILTSLVSLTLFWYGVGAIINQLINKKRSSGVGYLVSLFIAAFIIYIIFKIL